MKFLHKRQLFLNSFLKWQNSTIKVVTYRKMPVTNVMKLRKSINVKIWQLIEKVSGNCTILTP